MCIIIYKDSDVKLPSHKVLAQCAKTHKDGFGAMWRTPKGVRIVKGLFNIETIQKVVDAVPKDEQAAFHFRMSTHGNVCGGNCHPFPLSSRPDALTCNFGVFDTGLMHNGIIYNFGDRKDNHSDTMNFVKHIMRQKTSIVTSIEKSYKSNYGKFVVFLPEMTYSWGQFVKEDGLEFSNTTYREFVNIYGGCNTPTSNKKKTKGEKSGIYDNGRYIPLCGGDIPLVVAVNPELIRWIGEKGDYIAEYNGAFGHIYSYRGITIFAENGYDKLSLDYFKKELDALILEGEMEGIPCLPYP
jgi:hypothetical protein